MNKRIIAVLLVATVLFMCVFAACNKNEEQGIYVENKDINFVTDENGEKVLDSEGRFVVYATDEDGKKLKDDNDEYVTQLQEFQPIEDDGVVEDLGFIFELPEGWKTTNKFGVFTNKDASRTFEVSILEQFYEDYYKSTKSDYKAISQLEGVTATWSEDVDLGEEFKGLCRFSMQTKDGIIVMYIFENSKNLYKVRFLTDGDLNTAFADAEALLKVMKFKPYAYYTDITSKPFTTAKAITTTAAPLTTAVAE